MKLKNILKLIIPAIFLTSCSLMFPEELTFDESRVPGAYDGTITCSYDPCDFTETTSFTIAEGDSSFTLQFADSVSTHLPNLEFTIELDDKSFGEAVTVSGFIKLKDGQDWELNPFDQHYFYYWTYYDTQQEGERFEMRIYQPSPDNTALNPDYLELNGHKGVQ